MSDSCPVCGGGYMYGPGARSHAACLDTMQRSVELDKAVAWVLSDDPDKGDPPLLVLKLRTELKAIDNKKRRARLTTRRAADVQPWEEL